MKQLVLLFILFSSLSYAENVDSYAWGKLPFAHEGRFRPLSAYPHLWQKGEELKELPLLPARYPTGKWLSLRNLETLQGNFTAYPDSLFEAIATAYRLEQYDALTKHLWNGYQTIAGTPIKKGATSALYYPSVGQLKAEQLYHQLPLIPIVILLYLLGAISLFLTRYQEQKFLLIARCLIFSGFALHTAVLALRCYILGRPPVSNMFETLLYVPWVALLTGAIWSFVENQRFPLIAGVAVSTLLLILLEGLGLQGMEPAQAVLNSHYWLIVHVLLVVGSYGVFLLCGLLGHMALIASLQSRISERTLKQLHRSILHTMYLGTALLISGTILGGVWAAQSWGRFWDWDPKEAWAFITSCFYLLLIHARRFHRIGDFALSLGAAAGILVVSFTWYGVNYLLGTGLHSYGFGAGGSFFYFLFVGGELLFLATCLFLKTRKASHENTHA